MLQIHRNVADVDSIACLYYAMKACGRIDQVFYAGHNLLYWLDLFNTKTTYVCNSDKGVMGFGVVNELSTDCRRAEVSFAFLPECGARDAVRFGKMMLRDVFEQEPRIKYTYGTTPETNATGWKFAKLIGMKIVGVTPNYVTYQGEDCGAVISYAERNEYLNGTKP